MQIIGIDNQVIRPADELYEKYLKLVSHIMYI